MCCILTSSGIVRTVLSSSTSTANTAAEAPSLPAAKWRGVQPSYRKSDMTSKYATLVESSHSTDTIIDYTHHIHSVLPHTSQALSHNALLLLHFSIDNYQCMCYILTSFGIVRTVLSSSTSSANTSAETPFIRAAQWRGVSPNYRKSENQIRIQKNIEESQLRKSYFI